MNVYPPDEEIIRKSFYPLVWEDIKDVEGIYASESDDGSGARVVVLNGADRGEAPSYLFVTKGSLCAFSAHPKPRSGRFRRTNEVIVMAMREMPPR